MHNKVNMSKVGRGGMQKPYEANGRTYGRPATDVRNSGTQTFHNVSETRPGSGTGADTKGLARNCARC